MGYSEDIQNAKTLDELFSIWKNKNPSDGINHAEDLFIADGIVNPEVWNSGKKKRILFVLKEAYGDDWGDYTLATWLADKHPEKRMWNRIARIVYGMENTSAQEICRYKPKLTSSEHAASLDQIAVMNLKKSKGKSQSNYDDIAHYALHDKDEIRREFEMIDADIVLCGSTFKTLCNNVFDRELNKSEFCDNWYYNLELDGKKRLFIDFYHPANQWPDLINYYSVMGIYQQALIENMKGNEMLNNRSCD